MLTVRLDPELEQRLEKLAVNTKRPKSYYVKEALEQYLNEREAYLTALGALERKGHKPTLAELRRMIEVGDNSPDDEEFSFVKLNEELDREARDAKAR